MEPTRPAAPEGAPAGSRGSADVVVVLNRHSYAFRRRGHRTVRAELDAAFAARGLAPRVVEARSHGLEREIRAAAGGGARVVVVGGGDGTIRTGAAILQGGGAAMGVLPLGYRNHFARDLGIPIDLDGAVAAIVEAPERRIDMGEADGRPFVNNFALGIYPDIVRGRHRIEAFRWGRILAIARATWDTLRRFPVVHVRVRGRDAAETLVTPLVFVGNNEYAMGSGFGRRPRLDAGVLFLCAVRPRSRVGLLRICLRALVASAPRPKDVLCLVSDEVSVDLGHRTAWATLDGEVRKVRGRLVCRIRPGALRVVAPLPPPAPAEPAAA